MKDKPFAEKTYEEKTIWELVMGFPKPSDDEEAKRLVIEALQAATNKLCDTLKH